MRRTAQNAFTLIELLVVLAIMAIAGVSAIANYANFGEDQKLKSAVLDIQNQLRTAQTNATTNVKCDTDYYATWQVEVTNSTTLNLKCFISPNPPNNQKTLQLTANIQLKATESESCSPPNLPYSISFTPISGKMDLGDNNCTDLRFVLQNTKTGALKYLIIDKGGRIYAQ